MNKKLGDKMKTKMWLALLISLLNIIGCRASSDSPQILENDQATCPVTEPEWAKPANDAAFTDEPTFGHYYINENRTIWAASWWYENHILEAGEQGTKTGWFRPAGETLEITGTRLDAEAAPMLSTVPCCYPSKFQATGMAFPTEGCWQINAKATDEFLSFVVWVGPKLEPS